jgi:hypothetical protein
MKTSPAPRLLHRFIASSTLPEEGICWDCEKDFGPRACKAFRGINSDGTVLSVSICVKCAEKELRIIDRGTFRYPGRKIIGWVMLGLALFLGTFAVVSALAASMVTGAGLNLLWSAAAGCAAPVPALLGLYLLYSRRMVRFVPRRLRRLTPKGGSLRSWP